MADFRPIPGVLLGGNDAGDQFMIFGWWSGDDWYTFEPVVANPDGSGVGPWHVYCGEDNWYVLGREVQVPSS